MRLFILTLHLMSILLCPAAWSNATKELESSFATALILTDGDSLTLGFGNFDPKNFISPHHKQENQLDTLDLRQQLSLYSIPYSWQLKHTLFDYSVQLHAQASYLKQSQSVDIFETQVADHHSETMHSATFGVSFEKPISSKWFYQGQLNSHFMHYNNDYAYNSELSRQVLKPFTEGSYSNIQSNALVLNPSVTLMYRLPRSWGYYEYKLAADYSYGWAVSQPPSLDSVRPESLQIKNGIKAKFTMFDFYKFQQAFYIKAQRVDLHGDSQQPLGTDHFYEYGFGVLWDVSKWTSWFENFGVGININNGSNLDGGTIVFYFNEI